MIFEELKPQSDNQKKYKEALENEEYKIIGAFGLTGTGKSLFAIAYGISAVMKGKYKRFIIARPVVDISTGKTLTASELKEIFYRIASEYLEDIFPEEFNKIKELINSGKVAIVDPFYIRGRTFDNTVIFLDDAQNIPPEVSLEIIMRLGNNSRLIVAGDPILQKPLGVEKDGATILREILLNEENAVVIDLGLKDIVRPGAKKGIKMAFESKLRKRPLNEDEKRILEALKIHAPDADIVTVVSLKEEKEKYQLPQYVPDALILAKEGHQGRVIGKGGERINNVEKDTGFRLKVCEFTLNFEQIISAVHPVREIADYITDVDFEGNELVVRLRRRLGSFIGPKGAFVRFVDGLFKKLLGVGVKAITE